MFKKALRFEYLGGLFSLLISIVINLPMTLNKIFILTKGDYWLHLSFVENLLNNQPIPDFTFAHPVWQYGVIILARLFHLSSGNAAVLFQIIACCLFALLLYMAFLKTGIPWYGAVFFLRRAQPGYAAFYLCITRYLLLPGLYWNHHLP